MKAIIETGGKQYSVAEGTEIYVEKLAAAEGEKKDIQYIKSHYEELKKEVDNITDIIKKYKEE